MRLKSLLLAALTLAASAWSAGAADYYVAPLGKALTCGAAGTLACPWPSIDAAFASKKIVGGDTILLMDGDHGTVVIKNQLFDKQVTIQSQNAGTARLNSVHFDASTRNIRLRNLKVWRQDSDTTTSFLIRAYAGATYLTFENLEMRSRADSVNFLSWSKERWTTAATTGFALSSAFNVVRNNTLTGVRTAISAGPDSLVENNVIDGFCEDGMKGVSRSTFRNNLVKNSFKAIDGSHRDGFQSYTSGDPIVGLVLEGNTIIQWTSETSSVMNVALQGIGMFDGYYDDLIIRNNLIVTEHAHGITVTGTRGAQIVNNTVVNLKSLAATVPWIKVANRKDGALSQDVLVANNIAMSFAVLPSLPNNIVLVKNSVVLDMAQSFENPAKFDYRPKADSGFVDTAEAGDAPSTDISGVARPAGAGADRGAYETSLTGTGTGGTTDGTPPPDTHDQSGSVGGGHTIPATETAGTGLLGTGTVDTGAVPGGHAVTTTTNGTTTGGHLITTITSSNGPKFIKLHKN